MIRALLITVATLLALLGTAERASADEPLTSDREASAAAAAAPPIILMADRGFESACQSIARAVAGQLVDLPVAFEVAWTEGLAFDLAAEEQTAEAIGAEHGALAVIWVDVRREDHIYLYIGVPAKNRVVVRRIDGGLAGAGETVALIVRLSVQSLLAGGEGDVGDGATTIALPPAQPPPAPAVIGSKPAPAPTAVPPPAPTPRFELAAGYHLESFSTAAPAVHGAALNLGLRVWGELHAELGYQPLFGPLEARRDDLRLSLLLHGFWVGARYDWTPRPGFTLGGGLGLVIDWVIENVDTGPTLEATKSPNTVELALRPSLRAALALAGPLSAFLSAGVQVPVNRKRYVLVGEVETVVIEGWPVRPWITAGLSVSL